MELVKSVTEEYMIKRIIATGLLLFMMSIFTFPVMAEEYLHLNLPDEDAFDDAYRYGGITASVDNPPTGTTINQELSNYYGVPVATRAMELKWIRVDEYLYGDFDNVVTTIKPVVIKSVSPTIYFHISGWWFTQNEMMNLPKESLLYGQSPYAITDIE